MLLVFHCCGYTWAISQVSVYRTIGPTLVPFYAPYFEKVASTLVPVCPCVRLSVKKKENKAKVLKFHIWILHQKIELT